MTSFFSKIVINSYKKWLWNKSISERPKLVKKPFWAKLATKKMKLEILFPNYHKYKKSKIKHY